MSDADPVRQGALQRRVQRYGWDRASDVYEEGWREQLRPAQDGLFVLAKLQPGERVLDVACGTGLVTIAAAERVGPGGQVVGTDISQAMVERAAAISGERATTGVRFERGDAEALRFSDGSFDAVLCGLGLMYVPDPLRALREQRRVLRPGGRAVAAVWGVREACGWQAIFEIVDRRVASEVCPLFFRLGTGDALAASFEAAGFERVSSERLRTTLTYTDENEALQAAFAAGPVALAYARFDAPTRQAVHTEYLDSIGPFRDGTGYAVPGEFVLAVGHTAER